MRDCAELPARAAAAHGTGVPRAHHQAARRALPALLSQMDTAVSCCFR